VRKKILIPWTGGLDSTYAVVRAIEYGHDVVAIRFNIKNNDTQAISEIKAIEKLMKLSPFNRDGIKFEFREKSIEYNILRLNGYACVDLVQPPLWLTGLATICTDKIDEIRMGYVIGDCAISYLDDIKDLWKSLGKFCENGLPELRFPYIKMNKDGIISYFLKYYPDILDNLSYCEKPVIDGDIIVPCTTCKCCTVMDNALEIATR
jgi:7-cyano-7-deazaguanine synthase in queuosine biosynthesis